MIKITKKIQVWWPVTITLPEDGGGSSRNTAEFFLSAPKEKDRMAAISSAQNLVNLDKFIAHHCSDWRQVNDDDGKPLAYTTKNLLAAMDTLPSLRIAILEALGEVSAGKKRENDISETG